MEKIITFFISLTIVIVTTYFLEKEIKRDKKDDFDPVNISIFSVFIYLNYKLKSKEKMSKIFYLNIMALIVLIFTIVFSLLK